LELPVIDADDDEVAQAVGSIPRFRALDHDPSRLLPQELRVFHKMINTTIDHFMNVPGTSAQHPQSSLSLPRDFR
jgi:hypothetical protein